MNHFRGGPTHIQSTIIPLIPSKQPNLLKYRTTNNPTEKVPLKKAHLIENIQVTGSMHHSE